MQLIKDQNILAKLPEFDGHEAVYWIDDDAAGLKGAIAIHRQRGNKPSFGATRYWSYQSDTDVIREALRLAKSMSYKSVLAGLPYGGAKAVLLAPPAGANQAVNKSLLLQRYAQQVNELGGRFITGTDVGLDNDDIAEMKRHTAFVIGTKIDPSYYTAVGLLQAIKVALEEKFDDSEIAGRRFAVQGAGKVGAQLIESLIQSGAQVFAADIDQEKLAALSSRLPGLTVVPTDKIQSLEVDVFCPCALSRCLTQETVQVIKTPIIVGGANSQLDGFEIGDALFEKGVLYAPDYVVNAGGLISVVIEHENHGRIAEIAERVYNISYTLRTILDRSRLEKSSPHRVADSMAKEILTRG